MRMDCDVIRDLMPLCAEELASSKCRALVEEHLAECTACRAAFDAMRTPEPAITVNQSAAEHFKKLYKKQKHSLIVKIVWIVGSIAVLTGFLMAVLVWLFAASIGSAAVMRGNAKVEETCDIAEYSRYIGASAQEEYRNKWGMDETIFPAEITAGMNVQDYRMVCYNPWDAQYLSYLTVQYPEDAYRGECARLEQYPSTDYVGYYSVTEFPAGELLAMYADDYNGFVYAIRTPGQEHCITYVELIFCNNMGNTAQRPPGGSARRLFASFPPYCPIPPSDTYSIASSSLGNMPKNLLHIRRTVLCAVLPMLDLNWREYLPADYLPPGFDASEENPYRRSQLSEQRG